MSSAARPAFETGPWLVVIATVALAFKGIAAKLAYGAGIGVGTVLAYRFLFAVPLFLAGFWMLRGGSLAVNRTDLKDLAATGVLFTASTVSDFKSLELLDAGLARLVLMAFPAFIIVTTAAMERRLPSANRCIAFLVTFAGLALVLIKDDTTSRTLPVGGLAWAFAASVSYAMFWLKSRTVIARMGSTRFTALSNVATLVMVLPVSTAMEGSSVLVAGEVALFWCAVIAVACTVVPFFLLNEGIRRCGPQRASLLTLAGPVITAVAGWAFLGERMEPREVAGCAVVIAGVALAEGVFKLPRRRTLAKAQET